ncbi:G1/S-specific cyclin-E1 isoform X1 [Agrilus planipennis]|uniref:G1/S-specific cyclin-E1 isoform X1 n=1 Tax=Agrilus planipennis TaxID=224129 RepID=A0A1W4WKV1_AGRPL|nr:G1/S-specific cyclin-E1 isoform X2 [Agrilus planipennis]XP_025835638.1 G1/S-specific cyclin-E1 isoform X1 [Agrilus planipennis]
MEGELDTESREWKDILTEKGSVPSNETTVLQYETDHFDDKRSFSEELREHKNKVIWAFNYGEEVTKKTLENIQAYKQKTMESYSLSYVSPSDVKYGITNSNTDEPSTSTGTYSNHITPHSHKKHSCHRKSKRREITDEFSTPQKTRETPLPLLPWADSKEVWQNMVYKEEATSQTRNSRLFEDRTSFLPRMRAILLDWIMEVCEVYRLKRVTYYLAVDYVDRYLTIKLNIPKTQLQLIGVSCLFIAAKLEEIYPPKLSEFSYVCDGACTNAEILACEVLLLNTLGWDVNPMTPSGWLNLYMQIHYDAASVRRQKLREGLNRDFVFPQYSAYQFVRASHLMDLFSLDPGYLRFSYSVIAAAAMYFIFGKRVALTVSGLGWDQLKHCVEYMAVFYKVIRDTPDPKLHSIPTHEIDQRQLACYRYIRTKVPDLVPDENHSLQTHSVDLDYFEKATLMRLEQMGLRVEKTYIKKKKEKQKSNTPEKCKEDCQDKKNREEEEEMTLVIFDIEKVLDDAVSALDKKKTDETESTDSSPDSVKSSTRSTDTLTCFSPSSIPCEADIFTKDPKTKLTFDEILARLHDCANQLYPETATPKSTDSCNED